MREEYKAGEGFLVLKNSNALKWDSSLETGYDKVDHQHKKLMDAARDLAKAIEDGKSDNAVIEILYFLANYGVKHFTDEEQLQVDYGYPDYPGHKQTHDDFKNTITELTERVEREGPSAKLIDEVCFTIGTWLIDHIKGDDFQMVAFVKEADARAMAEAEAEAQKKL